MGVGVGGQEGGRREVFYIQVHGPGARTDSDWPSGLRAFVYWKFRRRITAIVYGGNSRRHHAHSNLAPGSHSSPLIISRAMRTRYLDRGLVLVVM